MDFMASSRQEMSSGLISYSLTLLHIIYTYMNNTLAL